MSAAYIGIGSNLGDRQKNIGIALEKLKSRKGIELKEVSSVIETEPAGDVNQPRFLNACCRLETLLYPDELLDCLKSIERELGRNENPLPPRISRQEQLEMLQEGNLDLSSQQPDAVSEEGRRKPQGEPKKWGPRTIDLDILFYDDIVMKGANLIIPHPLLHERLFVLRPLAEIAPGFIHPVLKKSINEIFLEYRVKNESS